MSTVKGHFRMTNQAMLELREEDASNSFWEGLPLENRMLEWGELRHFFFGSLRMLFSSASSPAFASVYRDIRDIWSGGHWRNACQKHHFMRRFDGQSSIAAYDESVAWISSEASLAVKLCSSEMEEDKKLSPSMFAGKSVDHLGNALHALQDSFAPSHAIRVGVDQESPGQISKLLVYAGEEKRNHRQHDFDWETADGSFSIRGWHAIKATKELLRCVGTTIEQASPSLVGWDKFSRVWLAFGQKTKNNADRFL